MPDTNLTKQQVHSFLAKLQKLIGERLESRDYVAEAVRKHAKDTNNTTSPEAAFIEAFVLNNLHACVSSELILAESEWAKRKPIGIACGTPVRNSGHPFNKVPGASPLRLYERWVGRDQRGRKSEFAPVCPDVALRAPYRIVFECKYFTQYAQTPAVSQLVEGLYQAFFYRALPTLAPQPGLKWGWDYEYSCFLAYDGTSNGRLVKAWSDLAKIHQRSWDESNIFVMILSGSDQ